MSTRFFKFLELAPPVSVEICVANCAHECPGMKERKTQLIKARVSANTKRGIDDLARPVKAKQLSFAKLSVSI